MKKISELLKQLFIPTKQTEQAVINTTVTQRYLFTITEIPKKGDISTNVLSLQRALREKGENPGPLDSEFGDKTEVAVIKFQKRFGMIGSGLIGPVTLEKLQIGLFKGAAPSTGHIVVGDYSHNNLTELMLSIGAKEVGVREHGFNAGKEVEKYQKAVDGVAQQEAYCMAFGQWLRLELCKWIVNNISFCNSMTARELSNRIPIGFSEGVVNTFDKSAKKYRVPNTQPRRGFWAFLKTYGSWKGHFYICTGDGVSHPSLEANTNVEGSREGDGVYAGRRSINGTKTKQHLGYIDFIQAVIDTLETIKKEKGA